VKTPPSSIARNVSRGNPIRTKEKRFGKNEMVLLAVIAAAHLAFACTGAKPPEATPVVRLITQGQGFRAETDQLALECKGDLATRVFLKAGGKWVTLSPDAGPPPLVSVGYGQDQEANFTLTGAPELQAGIQGPFGNADRVIVRAHNSSAFLNLTLTLDFPRRYPDLVILGSSVSNAHPSQPATVREISQGALRLSSGAVPAKGKDVLFWSLQGGGYKWGADYVIPLRAGFVQDNYTGPKGKSNGGGFPLVDLWRPEMGLAVALLDPKPALAWVPVSVNEQGAAEVHVTTRPAADLASGASYAPAPVMIVVHSGDFYQPVVRYRKLMEDLGVRVVKDYQPDDYAAAWCTWGYQRTFTVPGIEAKIPQMQAMGIKELILDDGWFDRFGDWRPTTAKFPRGEADMKALIDKVHAAGLTFRLWWSPGSADPGSEIDLQYPDWYILDKNGKREKASWNAYYLCPAYRPVRDYTAAITRHFVKDWSVDSFKLDGTSLNHAPLCFNPAHHHARPEESFEQWPGLLGEIREVARGLRPNFRVELCSCGITPTFHLATAFEQPTDSDPADHQVTARVKFLKAMFGPRSPVLQEYVGLLGQKEPNGKPYGYRLDLFPRAIGTGEVPSTFTMVLGKTHAKWMAIYNRTRPAEGEYLNLYDIRWENPEGHVIRKDSKFYFAFFTETPGGKFSGTVELRGLAAQSYKLTDYVSGRALGEAVGPTAKLSVNFQDALLLVAESSGVPPQGTR